MDDERLLAEALRAHAAGGVSPVAAGLPSNQPPDDDADADGVTHPQTDGASSRVRGRFRPLGLGRRDVAAPAASMPQGPVPRPAAGPTPYPTPGGGVPRPVPYGPAGPPAPVGRAADPGGWTGARVAWWSAVAVLGGGVLGGVLAVISLAAPG